MVNNFYFWARLNNSLLLYYSDYTNNKLALFKGVFYPEINSFIEIDNLNTNSFSLLTFNNSHLIVLDPFEINPFR
jgi:hypothetical protein